MKHTMKRSVSLVLALCMVLGLLALPGATVAHAEGETLISTPVYTHEMDEMSADYVPDGWSRSNQFAYASQIVTDAESGRTYYHMERKAEGTTTGAADSFAAYNNGAAYGAAVVRCDFMVDTDCETWTVYLPIFAASAKARTIGFNITQAATINGEAVVTGKWYTCELVYEGSETGKWTAYIDGVVFKTGTATASLQYINMGLNKSGGNSGVNTNDVIISGLGVGLCIDNLAVYNYVAGTSFAAAEESYSVAVDGTVATGWTKSSADAYLPSVTFASSDETVATVDGNGVVTGLKAGEVTITATPAASSGLTAATTKVVVTSGEQSVSATVGDKEYASVQEAVNAAVENGGTVVLQSSTDETITVAADKELFIDFNGNTVGEIVVNGTLYGIDTTTKDYTAEPLKVKVSGDGTVAPIHKVDDGSKAHAYAGYAAKVDEEGYATFNYFELKISSITLRPGDAGIGYKLQLAGNANVKAMLDAQDAFGVRVYRADNPEGGKKGYAGADGFQVGTQTKMVMIKNILSDAAEDMEQNVTNLDVKLCVEAYMCIGEEQVQITYTAGKSLREVLVAVDATVGSLEDGQKSELVTMYQKYDLGNTAYGDLAIDNIAGLASSEEG